MNILQYAQAKLQVLRAQLWTSLACQPLCLLGQASARSWAVYSRAAMRLHAICNRTPCLMKDEKLVAWRRGSWVLAFLRKEEKSCACFWRPTGALPAAATCLNWINMWDALFMMLAMTCPTAELATFTYILQTLAYHHSSLEARLSDTQFKG